MDQNRTMCWSRSRDIVVAIGTKERAMSPIRLGSMRDSARDIIFSATSTPAVEPT
jgi:hypothetical protein